MRALALVVLLVPGVAFAHNGGVTFGLQYGLGNWSFDGAHLGSQVPQPLADDFLAHTHGGQALNLRMGYNVLGYGGLEFDAVAMGWNVTTSDRGGGGFVGALGSFSPFNFFLPPERPWDAELLLGYGYGLVGQTEAVNGGAFNWGFRGEYYLSPNVALGASLRFFHPGFSNFILDYDHRDDPGETLPLPDHSGGFFWMLGAQVCVLLPVGPVPTPKVQPVNVDEPPAKTAK